jgi:hypothetical protein
MSNGLKVVVLDAAPTTPTVRMPGTRLHDAIKRVTAEQERRRGLSWPQLAGPAAHPYYTPRHSATATS